MTPDMIWTASVIVAAVLVVFLYWRDRERRPEQLSRRVAAHDRRVCEAIWRATLTAHNTRSQQ